MAGTDESKSFRPVRFAVLTVSDTRTLDDDRSGATLAALIGEAGHELVTRAIVTDDIADIQATIKLWAADTEIEAILTTGGTGITGRDRTPEAIRPLLTKELDGFAVLMHQISYAKIGTSTMQSRTVGGLVGTTYLFCLPGSTGACRDAWDGILKPQFDARHGPCNLVEMMPRLGESPNKPAV
jgi:molybdenum cofactor biosynthesis protein B